MGFVYNKKGIYDINVGYEGVIYKLAKEVCMIFDEKDFIKRLRLSISEAWKIFQEKVGNNVININKEASMQLHYAYILQNIIPLIIFNNDEKIIIELEASVKLPNNSSSEIDLLLIGEKLKQKHKIAVEMKCYKEYASSGGKRGATDIFMKDVYLDIEMLENYLSNSLCDETVFLAMNDLERLVVPKDKSAKCWDYDISNGYEIKGPKNITTPISGKDQNVNISKNYIFNWIKRGKYYFLEL